MVVFLIIILFGFFLADNIVKISVNVAANRVAIHPLPLLRVVEAVGKR